MKEIKPCPFCGNEEVIIVPTEVRNIDDTITMMGSVCCQKCEADGPLKVTEEYAIEAWNRAWEPRQIKNLSHELELRDGMDD